MTRLRNHLRQCAAAVICALAIVSAVTVAHEQTHHGDGLAITAHDASAHAIGPATGDAVHVLHCVLCHWTRYARPRQVGQLTHEPALAASLTIVRPPALVVSSAVGVLPPLRAPPAPAFHV